MSEQDNLPKAEGIEENTAAINNEEVNTASDELINEIDNSNAEDAEDESHLERHDIEEKDYDTLSLDELVLELENLVEHQKIQTIKKHVDGIKTAFDTKFNTLLEDKKEEFLAEGGNEIDFYYSTPLKKSFNNAFKEYRQKTKTYYKNLENNLKSNLSLRLEIIENMKTVIDNEDSIGNKHKQFKELQNQWKSAGPIPRDKYNNAWNSYHFNVERFYDLMHLDRDLRDKDFEHNLLEKLKIILRAEELVKDENTNRSFRELQNLHKIWKEDIGPVAREHREPVWERFKEATRKINDKRQDYYKELDALYIKNLEHKKEIISKIETLAAEKIDNHSGWQNKIKEIESLREAFFKAGKVPIKVNEATWAEFKAAVRSFNRNKNEYYKGLKGEQLNNLAKKLELVKIAEANMASEDFASTTPLMKKIQADWRNIGHVPRKDSDRIWKQFRGACNSYFDRIKEKRNEASAEEETAFTTKETLLKEVAAITLKGNQKEDLVTIKDYINQWKTIGRVPSNKRNIENDFNQTLDTLFTSLDLNKTEAEMIKFENKIQDLASAKDGRLLDNEQNYIRKKMDDVRGEINQLENNLQFFSNAKADNPLVKDVYKNIEKHKDSLGLWQNKYKLIKQLRKANEPQPEANNTETQETEN
ncbi:DUF349 domain-containing protein [Aurantibacter sp.]|uniref:DUF349 domain-containing protein n=1 Tax=Aurantibacter sp. TaxID=2807103 RepID=UPI0035C84FAB